MKASRLIDALQQVASSGGEADAREARTLASFGRSNVPPRLSASELRALRAFAKRSFASLVPLARSADAAIRHAAVFALGASGRPAAVAPIFALLVEPRDWFDHDHAHAALAMLGEAALVELELRALSRSPREAALALAALAQGRGRVFTHLERVRAKKKKLPEGFFQAYRNVKSPLALPVLVRAFDDAAHAADALEAAEEILCTVGHGNASAKARRGWIERLLRFLDEGDVNARAQALVCIGRLGDESALARVIEALTDADDDVVGAAASALAHLATDASLDALHAALDAKRASVRTIAAATLLASGHARGATKKRALATLVEGVVALPDKWARERAVILLHETRGGEAALLASMRGLSASKKKRAAEALVELAYLSARPVTSHARMRAQLARDDRRAFEAAWTRREREEAKITRELARVRETETPRSKPPRAR